MGLFYAICAFFGLRKVTFRAFDEEEGSWDVSKWVWLPTWDRGAFASRSGIVPENSAYFVSGYSFDMFLRRGARGRRKVRRPMEKGITLVESLIVIVVVGLAALIVAPKFFEAQDRAYIAEARCDLDMFRQALGMYEIDRGHYPQSLSRNWEATLVDPQGNIYCGLATGAFATFWYEYLPAEEHNLDSYEIRVRVAGTDHVLVATPAGVGDDTTHR